MRRRQGASNPGAWFEEPGGGGFNAARNLARLGFDVRLISPRGGDAAGEIVAEAARKLASTTSPSSSSTARRRAIPAILERDGNLVIALADMELYKLFRAAAADDPSAVRDAFEASDLILCDANLPAETLATIATRAATTCGKPLAAIAISPAKVVRLKPCLAGIDHLFLN